LAEEFSADATSHRGRRVRDHRLDLARQAAAPQIWSFRGLMNVDTLPFVLLTWA
jgi:hypothetical protein